MQKPLKNREVRKVPFMAYTIFAERRNFIPHLQRMQKPLKNREVRKAPFMAYILYAEGCLTPLPRDFQRLFSELFITVL